MLRVMYDGLVAAYPLRHSSTQGRLGVIERLLSMGADPNARRFDGGDTPLSFAAYHGNVDGLRALLDHVCSAC